MLILFILFILSILISCVFAGSETGIISCNRLKVSHAAAQGDFSARLAMRFLNRRGHLLSTILVGCNVGHIMSTLLFAELFVRINDSVSFDLTRIPSPESWFLTPTLLLFSEILPKSLYRTYSFNLTMKSIPVIAVFFYALDPVFRLIDVISKPFRRLGAKDYESERANVREEIVLVAIEGAKRGNIFESADNIMKSALEMKGRRIGDISVSLDEWKKTRAVYRESQMITEFRRDDGARSDEAVVFDDTASAPVGYVSLLDIAAQRNARGIGMSTFGPLMKPLPRLKKNMEILACLRRLPPDFPRYCSVVDNGAVVGILDKMTLFETAFAG